MFLRSSLRMALLLALLGVGAVPAAAHDLLTRNDSHLNYRRWHVFGGGGLNGLILDDGIKADGYDMAVRLGFGYSFTRRVQLDFYYQYNSTPIESPSPLGGGLQRSKFFFNSEVLRLLYRFDTAFGGAPVVPYLHLGTGLYQMTALSPLAGLDFPIGMQMPVGAGLETYLLRDRLSLRLEYGYHLLFDEEQNAGTLALLGLTNTSFDIQSLLLEFNFYFF